MSDCRPVSTPFPVGTKLTKEMSPKTDEQRKLWLTIGIFKPQISTSFRLHFDFSF
ncbi:hypothetical protein B0H10DRAFT_1926655 [Mycena sp. CBHHK59/15]|nr:hypothetical protein B0H10DRAFT_1926655 [Mycena sp. CBHHK59/15]